MGNFVKAVPKKCSREHNRGGTALRENSNHKLRGGGESLGEGAGSAAWGRETRGHLIRTPGASFVNREKKDSPKKGF